MAGDSAGKEIATLSSRKLGDVYEGSLRNNYLYNGKEFFDDADLNWYDYGFRNYDPQIGRFTQLDPLTFKYPFLTPYQYASCDPINNIDVDGLEGSIITRSIAQAGVSSLSKGVEAGSVVGAIGIRFGSLLKATTAVSLINSGLSLGKAGWSFKNVGGQLESSTRVGRWLSEMKDRAGTRLAMARDWVKDTWNQGGENFRNRWDARADPWHQLQDNPMAIMQYIVAPELSVVEQSIGLELRELQIATDVGEFDLRVSAEKIELETGQKTGAIINAAEAGAAKEGYNLLDDAADLIKLNGGKNSVTIETATQKIRYDLGGKAHGGVPTPHMQVYNKNFVDGVQKSVSRAGKEAIPMTQKDMEVVRKFLTGQ
ncbi:MAG TPA: RHS repeat-associated core domain-containing protein [Chitinophagaceae bacterium]|nr:RHS repeat-associated core domain-containing protein [Chitinophagaceae bacterium]